MNLTISYYGGLVEAELREEDEWEPARRAASGFPYLVTDEWEFFLFLVLNQKQALCLYVGKAGGHRTGEILTFDDPVDLECYPLHAELKIKQVVDETVMRDPANFSRQLQISFYGGLTEKMKHPESYNELCMRHHQFPYLAQDHNEDALFIILSPTKVVCLCTHNPKRFTTGQVVDVSPLELMPITVELYLHQEYAS